LLLSIIPRYIRRDGNVDEIKSNITLSLPVIILIGPAKYIFDDIYTKSILISKMQANIHVIIISETKTETVDITEYLEFCLRSLNPHNIYATMATGVAMK